MIGHTYSKGFIIYNKCRIHSLILDFDVENKITFFSLNTYTNNTPNSKVYKLLI